MSETLDRQIASTREILQLFLAGPGIQAVANQAARVGLPPQEACGLLDTIVKTRSLPEICAPLLASLGPDQPLLGRWLLAVAASRSLDTLPALPLTFEVQQFMLRQFQMFARLSQGRDENLLPDSRTFREYAEIALLRRFAAGLLHWKISGIPRSWPLQMNWRDAARTLATVWTIRGWSPCFEAHIPASGSPFLIETEYRRSYLRIARSMELQPRIRAIIGASWLHSEETICNSPHLAWLNRLFIDNGGILAHLGPAPPDSGFLVGSQQRRDLYAAGAYRPRNAVFIWPRRDLLEWANRQPASTTDPPIHKNHLPRDESRGIGQQKLQ